LPIAHPIGHNNGKSGRYPRLEACRPRYHVALIPEFFPMPAAPQVDSRVADPPTGFGEPPGATSVVDKSDLRVRRMFSSIAGRYDLLNRLLSLNIDQYWRSYTTRVAAPLPGVPVLDCCTGTADLALAYDRAAGGMSTILGTDFCREMLVLGHAKVRKASAVGRITLVEGDTQRLPVPSDTFGVVSVAFGLRNVHDTKRGVDEMIRVALPGGKVAILEFSRPRGRFLGRLYLAFFRHLLPRIGQTFAPNDDRAYDYLPRSVLEFPDGQAMLDLLAARGLTDLKQYPLTGGIATLYVGTKPVRAAASSMREPIV
jgi:demethylmenaquinone methyltransferase / 2-methoxy-6-polyprenyl-1,4-benzoquinol methylase